MKLPFSRKSFSNFRGRFQESESNSSFSSKVNPGASNAKSQSTMSSFNNDEQAPSQHPSSSHGSEQSFASMYTTLSHPQPDDWNYGHSPMQGVAPTSTPGSYGNPIDLTGGSESNPVDLTEYHTPAASSLTAHYSPGKNNAFGGSGPPNLYAPRVPQPYGPFAPNANAQGFRFQDAPSHRFHDPTPPFLYNPYTPPSVPEDLEFDPVQHLEQVKADADMARALQQEEYGWNNSFQAPNFGTSGNIPWAPNHEKCNYHGRMSSSCSGPLGYDSGTYGHRSETSQATPMEIDSPVGNYTDPTEVDIALLQQLRQFIAGFYGVPCGACNRTIKLNADDVPKLTRGWVSGNGEIRCGLRCSHCSAVTCPSCREIVDPNIPSVFAFHTTVAGKPMSVHFCCDRGRAFALWAFACGWDRLETVKPSKLVSVSQPGVAAQMPPTPDQYRPVAKGTGYGGDGYNPILAVLSRRPKGSQQPAQHAQRDQKEGQVSEAYFRLLALLLPSHEHTGELDISPPAFLLTIARSPLFERAAIMLSNDSIEDISRQYQLYDSMLDFVNNLANHTSTAGLIYKERQIYHPRHGSLLAVSFADESSRGYPKTTPKDTGKPLRDLLQRQGSQCRAMLQHARNNESEFSERGDLNMLAWSHRIVQMAGVYDILSTDQETNKGKQPAKAVPNLFEFHRLHAVHDVPEERILPTFSYASNAEEAANCVQPPRGRMKRLITEVATLQTSLPEGIYVRHGSSRLDIMKVMIIGPKGTPYEYGFFEFDLFCGLDYPQAPPKLQFKTTGGGKIRFNPNLYENGKVCLSLLGTWSGEPWRPDKSTLLQILVSVQGMILCEQPWYNEPGREGRADKLASDRYNRQIRGCTLEHAIQSWIYDFSIWNEVVSTHLMASAIDIKRSYASSGSKCKAAEAVLKSKGYLA